MIVFFALNFAIFEIDMQIDIEIDFATKMTFDLMIDSKRNIIDIELKLFVNFSNLNDLKNCFVLIFD